MRRQALLGIGIGLLTSFVPPTALAQAPDIRGARIDLVAKTTDVLTLTIENRRDVAIMAWHIGLFAPGASKPRSTAISDFTGTIRGGSRSNSGPIQPGERRTMRARQLQSEGRRPTVQLIDRLIEQAERTPEEFLAGANASVERMDQER
jgi:hypothetical protein